MPTTAPWAAEALAGGLAASMACVCTNPIDVLKTRVQAEGASRSILSTALSLPRREGLGALQLGLLPAVGYNFTMNSLRFSCFAVLSPVLGDAVAGLGAGTIAAVAATPFAVLRVRLQHRLHSPPQRTTSASDLRPAPLLLPRHQHSPTALQHHVVHPPPVCSCSCIASSSAAGPPSLPGGAAWASPWSPRLAAAFSSLSTAHGRAGPVRGSLPPSVLSLVLPSLFDNIHTFAATQAMRVGSASAVQFAAYRLARRAVDDLPLPTHVADGLAATTSTTLATFAFNPFDVIATRLYAADGAQRYRGPVDCFRSTLHHEGLTGLYRGLGTNLLRNLPHGVLTFVFYEEIRRSGLIASLLG